MEYSLFSENDNPIVYHGYFWLVSDLHTCMFILNIHTYLFTFKVYFLVKHVCTHIIINDAYLANFVQHSISAIHQTKLA